MHGTLVRYSRGGGGGSKIIVRHCFEQNAFFIAGEGGSKLSGGPAILIIVMTKLSQKNS